MLEIIPNWHPIFVHFSVAFISFIGVLQLVIWLRPNSPKRNELIFMQKALILVTIFSVVLTVLTGWLAFNSVAHDTPSHMAMTDHRNWALATASVFLVSAILFFTRPNLRNGLVGVMLLMSAGLVAVTGFKGGEVVYRYGLGVMSLPQLSESSGEGSDGHDHEHGATENSHGNGMDTDKLTNSAKPVEKQHLNDGHNH